MNMTIDEKRDVALQRIGQPFCLQITYLEQKTLDQEGSPYVVALPSSRGRAGFKDTL
jgi:hypothetical protein